MQELMERGSRIIAGVREPNFSSEKPIRSLSGKRGQSGRLFIRRCGGIQIGTGRRSLHVAQKAVSGRFSMERECLKVENTLLPTFLVNEGKIANSLIDGVSPHMSASVAGSTKIPAAGSVRARSDH